jgi:hypothetical protein
VPLIIGAVSDAADKRSNTAARRLRVATPTEEDSRAVVGLERTVEVRQQRSVDPLSREIRRS